jgi:HK97 family phage portal protein
MVDDHELTALIERPNQFWSGELLWQATVLSLALSGNGYWVKVTDRQLRVIELWWAPSSLIEPRWPLDGSEFISHYEYKPGTQTITLKPSEVVHFRWGVDPENQRLGLSPLASVLREVYSDIEAAAFSAALLRNMGVPGLIISPDGDAVIGDDDMAAAEAAMEEKFTGSRRGKPLIAGAPTKVQQFGFSPEQMDLRSLRRLPEERVSAVLGVPAIVAGLGAGLDRSTFANMAEAREMAYESCIIPVQRLMASDLKNQLLEDFESDLKAVRCRFDLTEVRVLQEDENKKTERKLKELNGGAITLAEYRRETGRDAEDSYDVFLRPFSLTEVPADQVGVVPEVSPPTSGAPPLPTGEERPEETEDGEEVFPDAKRGRKASQMQQRLMRELLKREQSLAGSFTAELVDEFVKLGDKCGDAAAQILKDHRPEEFKDAEEDAALRGLADRIATSAGVASFTRSNIEPALEVQYRRVADDTVATIRKHTDIPVDLPDEVARNIISLGGKRAGLIDVNNSTRTAIFRALRESRELGEGPAAAARRIRSHVPAGRFGNAGPQYRSQLIARTETKYAQNRSSIEAYKNSEAVRGLLAFDAQGSGESDPDCEARDGKVFTFEEAEVELLQEHPNGTLSFAPVV